MMSEIMETDSISGLCCMSGTCFGYSLANGTVGVYDKNSRWWRIKVIGVVAECAKVLSSMFRGGVCRPVSGMLTSFAGAYLVGSLEPRAWQWANKYKKYVIIRQKKSAAMDTQHIERSPYSVNLGAQF